ncbi:CopD family protein [Chloroflexota bacterium]
MPGLVTLSILNWFHLVATVVWIGGVFINNLALSPSARKSLEPPIMGKFIGTYVKRFGVLAYVSMGVLIITGVIMMVMNPHNGSTAATGNLWTQFTIVKHVFVAILIIIGIYIMQFLSPKMERLGAKGPSPEVAKLQKQLIVLGITSLIVASIILAFTAITGAISVLS